MIRRTIHTFSLLLLALFFFASCDKELLGDDPASGMGNEKIRLEVSIGTADVYPSGRQTRVETDTDANYTSSWSNDDEVGIYIVKGSGNLLPSGNWVDNMKMTYNNGTWTYTFPTGTGYYPQDGDKLSFYAYYPYVSGLADATNISISAQADQSSTNKFNKSHLLTASITNVGKSKTPVQLAFAHKMTLVELSVRSGDSRAQMSAQVTVTIEGCKQATTLNLVTGSIAASGSAAAIKMYRVEQSADGDYLTKYTYRALVPAQTVTAGAELFRFTLGNSMSHKPTQAIVLNAGQMKPYEVRLESPSFDSSHVYAVGDYYPYRGFPVLGIVFEVSNGGKSGKIISLKESGYLSWGKYNERTDAEDRNSGRKNMNRILTNFTIAEYPPFAFVHGMNPPGTTYAENDMGKWYLPARNELLLAREVWNGGPENYETHPGSRAAFESKLTAAGGTGTFGLSLWTSTEGTFPDEATTALATVFADGLPITTRYKINTLSCRGILAF